MKFKDVKLGGKLSIGFGVLILFSLILGGMAINSMSNISKESKVLANEYIPEVRIATDLRGAANRIMYAMRGYGLTEDKVYYNDAIREMELLQKAIRDGEKLISTTTRLAKLEEELIVAKKAADNYLELVEQTVSINQMLRDDRAQMDEAASVYISNCTKYTENQYRLMANEIDNLDPSQERLTKIKLINDIIDEGNEVRIGNFKSQAKRDTKIFKDALEQFPKVYALIDEIRRYTKLQSDLIALTEIENGANEYEKAMKSFIDNWSKRNELAIKRDAAGKELIASCDATTNAGLSGTQDIADGAIGILNKSNMAMIIGLMLALVFGIAFAYFLTTLIVRPIKEGMNFAQELSTGNLTAEINIDQNDEIGQLAKAL